MLTDGRAGTLGGGRRAGDGAIPVAYDRPDRWQRRWNDIRHYRHHRGRDQDLVRPEGSFERSGDGEPEKPE